jgi:hypothetical protein
VAAAAAAAAAARGVMRFGSVLIQDVGNKIEREKLEKSSRPGGGEKLIHSQALFSSNYQNQQKRSFQFETFSE